MIVGSVCSGIEAATVAWKPLGWKFAFYSEIEAAPSAVLAHHYPETPNHGDFTTIREGEYGAIDLLVGGTPCQSFSVAGLRGGLADDRGNLALEYLRLADRLRPRWLVWENVPGVLSSNGGRDFGAILGGMVELGYGFAYRILDAQFIRVDGFGRAVPQRRRRVFVVGYLGDWRRPAAVLFERASLSGHPAPRRNEGTKLADSPAYGIDRDCLDRSGEGVGGTAGERSGLGIEAGIAQTIEAKGPGAIAAMVAPAISASNPYGDHESREGLLVAHSLRAEGFDASEDGTGRGTPIVPVAFGDNDTRGPIEVATAVNAHGGPCGRLDFESETFIAFHGAQDPDASGDVTHPLGRNGGLEACIAFSCKDHGADATQEGAAPTLRAMGHDRSHANAGGQLAVALTAETMYGVSHADASQTGPDQALRALREAVGEKAYSEWGLGVVAALRAQEVLRSGVHGEGVRCAADDRHELDDKPLPREEAGSAGAVRALWEAGCVGCPPSGWQPPERLAQELGAYLSVLPHQRASAARLLLGLWRASEGLGLLRQALSAFQEVWRSTSQQSQPAHSSWAVRRLTPLECERLMGFPDNYTAVPWRGGIMPDGPRYKMLGNSFAVNVVRWIGQRIQAVEEIDAAAVVRSAHSLDAA